jgi:serine/threonine protein kinase
MAAPAARQALILDRGDIVTDESRWERIAELFDRLLAGSDLTTTLASERNEEIRAAVSDLWRHHAGASRDGFLAEGPEFTVLPVFKPGQILLNRFSIERMLGQGGMGEVYLARDSTIEELVAIKTIARLLSPSPSLRKRIIAEVQNARRVTHPNVCRIHELFQDGNSVFFVMEYIEGQILNEALAKELSHADSSHIALQLADGLAAAHRTGVIHGDLKPANVMIVRGAVSRTVIMDFGLARAVTGGSASIDYLSVRAGTAEFMAPELLAGQVPTMHSDIYALGKIGRMLQPEESVWESCTASQAEDRPSAQAVVSRLNSRSSRRAWLGIAALASAGGAWSIWGRGPAALALPEGARVLVNGFREMAVTPQMARLARSLLVSALHQSPRLRVVNDEDFLPEAQRLQSNGKLFLSGGQLESVSQKLRATHWIDADLWQSSDRLSIQLQVRKASEQQPLTQASFRDSPGVIALVKNSALWVRTRAGESEQSLQSNPADVSLYTSRVAEALQKYFEGMEHYSSAQMDLAVPLFEEAVRLDPNFAQAQGMLGTVLNAMGRYEEGFEHTEIAHRLAAKLPDRERVPIDAAYASLTDDVIEMSRNAFRNVDYNADEPRAYRTLARVLCRSGAAEDSIQYNRRAVELSGGDELQRSELINNLCEAGQFEAALSEFEKAARDGIRNSWLYGSGGLAYLGLERYDEARQALEHEPAGNFRTVEVQRAAVLSGQLESALAAMREARAAKLSSLEKHRVNETLCGLYFVMGQSDQAIPIVREMADLPVYPQMARRLDASVFWAARLKDRVALTTARERLDQIARRWPNSFTNGIEQHADGLAAWLDGSMQAAETAMLSACGTAFSPWTIFDLADFYTSIGKPAIAQDYFERFERHRGVMLSFWFTGTIVFGWLRHATAAQAASDRARAQRLSQKVLDHWGRAYPHLEIVEQARKINQTTH